VRLSVVVVVVGFAVRLSVVVEVGRDELHCCLAMLEAPCGSLRVRLSVVVVVVGFAVRLSVVVEVGRDELHCCLAKSALHCRRAKPALHCGGVVWSVGGNDGGGWYQSGEWCNCKPMADVVVGVVS